MKWLNGNRMRIVVVGVVAAIVLGGGNAKADFTFGQPTNLGPKINTNNTDWTPCLSEDGLELYFTSYSREGGHGDGDIWVSARSTMQDEWGQPENLGQGINTPADESGPSVSVDGLTLYFNRGLSESGTYDLWVTKRVTRNDPWGEPEKLPPPVNSDDDEALPSISSDRLELYFISGHLVFAEYGESQLKVTVTKRKSENDPWETPIELGSAVNSWACQYTPRISKDGLVLFFSDFWNSPPRPDGFGSLDMWLTRRMTKDGEWSEPVNLGSQINTVFHEDSAIVSADGSMLYFVSDRIGGSGGWDIWQAPILPVVDFDDDGEVGMNDLLIMIESWGSDDSNCDIGPMPWGDGVVDEADLESLMKHWGQDVTGIVTHWKLDESEGTIAYDSVGTNDANLVGDPVWQPADGWLDGALELDGVDDGAEAGFVLDPKDGPFSAFAWVKGGGPDQVIVSQAKGDFGRGINWLLTDSLGNLKSEFVWLNYGVWDPGPDLFSSAQITDGQWHHVGFVCDLYNVSRILYVDGIEVAKDTMQEGSFIHDEDGGINIGFQASILHRPGYFSGLIDDVRIYDRALTVEQITELAQ